MVPRRQRRPEDLHPHEPPEVQEPRPPPKASLFVLDPTNPYRSVEVRAEIELTPDPDKALLPKFAEHYNVPVEALEDSGDDRVIATFKPVRVITNG